MSTLHHEQCHAMPAQPSPALYVDHIAGRGVELFQAACARDLEGIVAKLAGGAYTPESTTWVKIKNRAYSRAEGRRISSTGALRGLAHRFPDGTAPHVLRLVRQWPLRAHDGRALALRSRGQRDR